MTGRRVHSPERDNVLDEWAFFRPWGIPWWVLADRLGKDREWVRRTLIAAERAGDPRGYRDRPDQSPSGTYASLRTQRESARGWVA
jgi:hypothetical protein